MSLISVADKLVNLVAPRPGIIDAMRVEVDQSGKIEFTKDDTVLAFSNGISFALLVPATVKRTCISELRSRGLSGPTLYVQLFATVLFFLLRDHSPHFSSIVIDVEYSGKEQLIKGHLLNLAHRTGCQLDANRIHFQQIGKHSPAHTIALETFRGKRTPDMVLDEGSLLGQFRK